ncbi:MAG: sigma-70 family RNA polymerase sigma factor [Solirubrobacteraceae bacterium]
MGHTMQIGDDLDRLAEEERLARSAAAGDGSAFLTLYDRYESRIFNYCQRLLGSGEDAADATLETFHEVLRRLSKLDEGCEPDIAAYLYTAARKASYDMLGRRKRGDPAGEIPETPSVGVDWLAVGALDEAPEREALLASFREDVRAASARLPDPHREVLALRELDELSYDEIAGIMDMNRNSAAQLTSRAGIKLRDELRGSTLAAIAVSSPECERALPLVSLRQDGQLRENEHRAWLEAHLAGCDTCRVSAEAIEEASVSYRVWAAVLPPAWLRQATVERAGELVGADWSEVARTPWGAELDEATGDHGWGPEGEQIRHERAIPHPAGATAAPLFEQHGGPEEEHDEPEAEADEWEAEENEVDKEERRRRLAALIGGIVLILALIGAVALIFGGGSEPERAGPGAQKRATPPTSALSGAGAVAAPPTSPGDAKPVKRKRREKVGGGAGAPGAGPGADGGIPTNSGPALTPQPIRPPGSPDKQTPTTPNKPDRPTNTTPKPTTPAPPPPDTHPAPP